MEPKTVKQLIEELSRFDPDAKIAVYDYDYKNHCIPVIDKMDESERCVILCGNQIDF